jgi:hypothetical protein
MAFLVVDFALLGAPDSRGQAWHLVAESAFGAAAEQALCPAAGYALGALAATRALAWHASLLVIPSLPGPVLEIGAWLLFLAQAGVLAWLFTCMLLGVWALVDERLRQARVPGGAPARHAGASTVSTAFIYTILLLALPYLYAVHQLRDFDPATLEQPARQLVRWANPCRADPALATLSGALDERLQATRAEALAAADRQIEASLDTFFARAGQGVDAYLDWYFTVVGEYQRLAAAAMGDFGALMATQLEQRLFADTGFEAWLEDLYAELDADAAAHLGRLARASGWDLQAVAASSDCAFELVPGAAADGLERIADFGRDAQRAGSAAAAGAAAGAVTAKLLSKQVAGAVAAKLAAKKSFQTAAALAAKAGAKKGGSSLASALGATALCAPSGPWAVLCGIGAGAVTWLAVDKAMVEIDEARFRAEMRADLLGVLEEQRAVLAAALRERQALMIDAGLQALAERLGRRYVPARE